MDLNRWTLTFRDPVVQEEYRGFYNQETRAFIRLGMMLSILFWLIVIVASRWLFEAHWGTIALLAGTLILPYFTAVVCITFIDRLLPSYQWLTALSNAMAGTLWVYICHVLLRNDLAAMMGVLVIQYFAFLVLRLRVKHGLAATLTYAILYQILLATSTHLTADTIVLISIGIWTIEGFSIVGAYLMSLNTCRIFWQQKEIVREQERAERLLLNILPAPIAHRLKQDELNVADSYESTSVLFADIVGFTGLSERLGPREVVQLLNHVFSRFDDLTLRFGLEKIKTIGDAYMVAAGLPERRVDHAEAIADMALAMHAALPAISSEVRQALALRIGINSGPVVAGVIGKRKFLYDLWGDAVNTAARMESHGLPGETQVTDSMRQLLFGKFGFEARGVLDIKGKGPMQVHLLKARLNS